MSGAWCVVRDVADLRAPSFRVQRGGRAGLLRTWRVAGVGSVRGASPLRGLPGTAGDGAQLRGLQELGVLLLDLYSHAEAERAMILNEHVTSYHVKFEGRCKRSRRQVKPQDVGPATLSHMRTAVAA